MSEQAPALGPALAEVRAWIGHRVDGSTGEEIGQASAVFVDADNGAPSWLVVKRGRFRGALVVVPLRDCAAASGQVWVAHGGDAIRSSPIVDPSRPLLREHELTICGHYGIGQSVGRAAEVVGRADGSVTSRPG
jgi:hypothetical protein